MRTHTRFRRLTLRSATGFSQREKHHLTYAKSFSENPFVYFAWFAVNPLTDGHDSGKMDTK